jgi:hypothetical protein
LAAPGGCGPSDDGNLKQLLKQPASSPGSVSQPEWKIDERGKRLETRVETDGEVIVAVAKRASSPWLAGLLPNGTVTCSGKFVVDETRTLDITSATSALGMEPGVLLIYRQQVVKLQLVDMLEIQTASPTYREGLLRHQASVAMLAYRERLVDYKYKNKDVENDPVILDKADRRIGLLKDLATSPEHRVILFQGDESIEDSGHDDSLFAEITGGDPFTAEHVMFFVPGTSTTFNSGFRPKKDGEGGKSDFVQSNNWVRSTELIRQEAEYQANIDRSSSDTKESVAGIAWLGYDAPDCIPIQPILDENEGGTCTGKGIGAGDNKFAIEGAPGLAAWTNMITNENQHVAYVGHSYGTVVTGAAVWLGGTEAVDDIVSVGSPGLGVRLGTRADLDQSLTPVPTCEYLEPSFLDRDSDSNRWPADCFGKLNSQHLWAGIGKDDGITICDKGSFTYREQRIPLKDCHGTGPHLPTFGGHLFHVNCPADDPPPDGCPTNQPIVGTGDPGDAHSSYYKVISQKKDTDLAKPRTTRKKESLRNTAKVVAGNYSNMSMEDIGQGRMPSDWVSETQPLIQPVSQRDLSNLKAPKDACSPFVANDEDHQLADGKFEGRTSDMGVESITVDESVIADLNGDGVDDGVVTIICSGGGSGSAEALLALIAGQGNVIDVAYASSLPPGSSGGIEKMVVTDGVVELTLFVFNDNDPMCCPSGRSEGQLKWDGSTLKLVE